MSSYNTCLSFVLPVAEDQVDGVVALANCIDEILTYGDDRLEDLREQGYGEKTIGAAFEIASDEDYWGINVVKTEDGRVWIHADEVPNVDALITFVQKVLIDLDSNEIVSFEWANTSDKPLLDAYGGGAAVISKSDYDITNTELWVDKARKKLQAAA